MAARGYTDTKDVTKSVLGRAQAARQKPLQIAGELQALQTSCSVDHRGAAAWQQPEQSTGELQTLQTATQQAAQRLAAIDRQASLEHRVESSEKTTTEQSTGELQVLAVAEGTDVDQMSIEEEEVIVVEAGEESSEEMEEVQEKAEAIPGVATGVYNATTVNDQIFEELRLSSDVALEVQQCWQSFLGAHASRLVAGDAIYTALLDAAPHLQRLFKTPRATMAMSFINGLSRIIELLSDPKGLKVVVETLGYQHLNWEITGPRVILFRVAIVGVLVADMGGRLSQKARVGFATLLNYVGGSFIFIHRREFYLRLNVVREAWRRRIVEDENLHEGGREDVEG